MSPPPTPPISPTFKQAFQGCTGICDARVMWDHATGRSRGYGFVSFRSREEAEAAIQVRWVLVFLGGGGEARAAMPRRTHPCSPCAALAMALHSGSARPLFSPPPSPSLHALLQAMHGQFIGTRRVRCGWAQHKTDNMVGMDPQLLDKADPTNTNVYVGNLSPELSGEGGTLLLRCSLGERARACLPAAHVQGVGQQHACGLAIRLILCVAANCLTTSPPAFVPAC